MEPAFAGKGQISYQGIDRRKKLQDCKKSQQYEFSRVDALLQAQELFSDIKIIRTEQDLAVVAAKIDGINNLAEHFGIL